MDIGNYFTSCGVKTLRILAQVITHDFCGFSQHTLHGMQSPCSQECDEVRWAYAMPVCVLFVPSRLGIVFNPGAGAITDDSQSAKEIDPYFRSKRCDGPCYCKPDFILWNGWVKPESVVAYDRNLISAVGGIWPYNHLIDSPARYHWAISALYLSQIND